MFGLFKPKLAPEGPVEIAGSVEIDCPAEEVYAMVDWADDRNAKRATGNTVAAVDGKPNRFDMHMPSIPELAFEFLVTEAVPHRRYAYGTVIRPNSGLLAHCHESFGFEDLSEGRCRVSVLTAATFVEGLRMREYVHEVKVMAASVQSALLKLKLQAEHGAECAKAVERNTLL